LTDLYLRVHPTPYSPNPKSFIKDICRVNPHQLASTVGSRGVGIMNLTAFSLLANSSSEGDKNQKTELTIGSLSFCVRFRVRFALQIQRNWIRRRAKPRQCLDHRWALPAR
jgi:hypothetical protein